jgi:type IV pilus assembly protein PilB
MLLRHGLVGEEDLEGAYAKVRENGGAITSALVANAGLSEERLVEFLRREYRLPVVDPAEIDVPPDVTSVLPAILASKYHVVPVGRDGNTLTLAMADPTNLVAINEVKFVTGLDVRAAIAPPGSVERALERYYDRGVQYGEVLHALDSEEPDLVQQEQADQRALEKATEEAPVVKLVNALLADAIKRRASDIHIEPYERILRVRFRIDGVLHEIMQPPVKLKNAMTSRIKVMSSLDIAERRLPQDGRIKVRISSGEIDLRVSTLPTLFGEKVVLRILDKTATHMDINRIGFSEAAIRTFRAAIHKPHGMILVTGPTGSGKTTTLYAALTELNDVETNISTAEDPVEYNLVGINQVQMHDDIGLNFAAALRAFLRQDPDVIMVGEIRDFETAEIAVKAALTGHLVLSTVHTNDAPSTVNRLLNMGIEPFLIGSSVNLILAQRLARLNCPKCSQAVEIPAEVMVDLGVPAEQAVAVTGKKGNGCPNCSGTGFRGRCALYELMPMSDSLREMVLAGASAAEIKQQAIADGMETLRQSGIGKIRAGLTTPEEILRVTISD